MAEVLEDGLTKGDAPPPKKKSLFAKSTWSKPAKPVEHKEGIDFFTRADELWENCVAEDERRRQKRQIKLERKRSTASAERKPSDTPESKRRRVTPKADPEHHSSQDSPNHDDPEEASWTRRESTLSTPGSRKSQSSSSRQKSQASPVTLSERYSRDIHAQKTQAKRSNVSGKGYISLSDSDNEAVHAAGGSNVLRPINLDDDVLPIAPLKPIVPVEDDPDMSDDEFSELKIEARKREQQKALDRLKAGQSFEKQNHGTNTSGRQIHAVDDIFEERTTVVEDPVVEIFVSSMIEGSVPLRAQRRLMQRLKEVKLAWCDRQSISSQPLSKDFRESIFLTWRDKRLYDYTSCKSLGLKIDGSGQIFSDGEGFAEGKVHLEAWTQDLFDKHQDRLSKQAHGDEEYEPEEVKADEVEKTRIVLKARGLKDFKIIVKPTTTVQKLITAYRNAVNIPEESNIALHFDGDILDPGSNVGDTELADMDTVEVHIR